MPIVFYLNPGATDEVCDVVREVVLSRNPGGY